MRRIWIMGGAFDRDAPEHNIQSDTFAAQRVFDSDAPITVLPLDVTERIRLTHKDVEAIRQSGPVGEQLGIDIRRWWEVRGTAWNVPHDPLTLLALCHPDLFELSPAGRVQVDPLSGTTSFDPGQSGNVRIATDLDTPRVTDLLMRTLTNSSVRTAAR